MKKNSAKTIKKSVHKNAHISIKNYSIILLYFIICLGIIASVWIVKTQQTKTKNKAATPNETDYIATCLNYAFEQSWGRPGSGNGQFSFPTGLVYSNGNVYVSDKNNHRIQKFNAYGDYVTSFGQGITPQGIAADNDGSIYVVDNGDIDKVIKYTNEIKVGEWGTSIPQAGTNARLNNPYGIAVRNGLVYVTSTNDRKVYIFTTEGAYYGHFSVMNLSYGFLMGIAVDTSGNIFLTDNTKGTLRKIQYNGVNSIQVLWTAHELLTNPNYITSDRWGYIYVAEGGNKNRISKFYPDGKMFDQHWGSTGNGDGQFNLPQMVGLDMTQNMYVTDASNNKILKFNCIEYPPTPTPTPTKRTLPTRSPTPEKSRGKLFPSPTPIFDNE